MLVILVCNKYFRGLLGNLSILIGIAVGTVVAIVYDKVNAVGISSGEIISMMDPKAIQRLQEAKWFSFVKPLAYGMPKFEIGSIITMILVVIVIMTQATGSMMAIHNISGKKMGEEELKRGLRSNGMSTMFAGLFNSYPVTAFAQNIGMLSLTNVVSRFVTALSGVILFALAFLPKFAAAFAAIPKPVLGGAGFAMFGVVIVGGIRTLGKVDYDGNKNNIIVAVSIGLSMITTVAPNFFFQVHPMLRGVLGDITLGSVSAILLNLFFNVLPNLKPKEKK